MIIHCIELGHLQFCRALAVGRCLSVRQTHVLYSNGLKSPFILETVVYCSIDSLTTNKFFRMIHMERGVFLWVTNVPMGRDPSAPQFWEPYIGYLCLHLLTHYDQIRRGNTYGGRACFKGSATPLHVAQMCRAVCQR